MFLFRCSSPFSKVKFTIKVLKLKNYKDPSNLRLLLTGMVLFSLTVGVFVTSTIAWFDISNNLIVNNMTMTFGKDHDNVKIGFSEDGDFYSDVDSTILEREVGFKHDQAFFPLTSGFQNEWLTSSTPFEGTLPVLHTDPVEGNIVATKGFLQFPLYFKTSEDGYIYLDGATSFSANTDENLKAAKKLHLQPSDLNEIAFCSRASFYSEDYGFKIFEPNVSASSKTALGGRLDLQPFDGYFDYEKATDSEIMYGDYNRNDNPTLFYGVASTEDSLYEGANTCFNAATKAGIRPLDLAASANQGGLKIAQEMTFTLAELGAPAGGGRLGVGRPLAYCYAGQPKKVILTVYVEGWDLDTVQAVSAASFNMNIVFTALMMPKVD